MSIERKLIGTVDASSGPAVYVEDVFSTWLYSGTGSSQTIANGIDLSTKGGLVWIKGRSGATDHAIYDTARGATYDIASNLTTAQTTQSTGLAAFGTTGFTVGALAKLNTSASTYASWTFAKQAKFFDVVTWTGNNDGTGFARSIAHSLGSTPGMIILKQTSGTRVWYVYHKSLNVDPTYGPYTLFLHQNNTQSNSNTFGTSAPTSVNFYVSGNGTNENGQTYVAYLFADSNSGGFGPAGTDSVVACGSYTGNGSASGPTVTLGWEPQFVIIKNASATGDWNIFDNMRGIPTGSADPYLFANTSGAEATTNGDLIDLTPTGFVIKSVDPQVNTSSNTYIYLAIRRGPMRTPTDATKVFAPVAYTGSSSAQTVTTNIQTAGDASVWIKRRNNDPFDGGRDWAQYDVLRGSGVYLQSSQTSAELSDSGLGITSFNMNGFTIGGGAYQFNESTGTFAAYTFRRAPGFFDVVCYTGTGSATTVAHNLGVVPELMIFKARTAGTGTKNWTVYASPIWGSGIGGYPGYDLLQLNGNSFAQYNNTSLNSTQPTNAAFSLGSNHEVNEANGNFVAYLFASCPGVQYINSYVGDGTTGRVINCGFASGARFVCIKATSTTGNWWVFDSSRGIVSANDPVLALNSTAAEITSADAIDPSSTGFIVNQEATCSLNASGVTYLVWAIA